MRFLTGGLARTDFNNLGRDGIAVLPGDAFNPIPEPGDTVLLQDYEGQSVSAHVVSLASDRIVVQAHWETLAAAETIEALSGPYRGLALESGRSTGSLANYLASTRTGVDTASRHRIARLVA